VVERIFLFGLLLRLFVGVLYSGIKTSMQLWPNLKAASFVSDDIETSLNFPDAFNSV
jgi:hypothetical protein